jgi:Kdo2-lipid IVA lauroyltransferase/acyltransferase
MRFQLERFAFWIMRSFAYLLPRRLFLFIGSAIGVLAFYLDRRHRSIAFQNYSQAFPNASSEESKKTIRSCYSFFGRYLFDMLTYFQGFPPGRVEEFEYEGLQHLEQAYARKNGVIIFTGHWGVWELMGIAQGFKGYPLSVIARKLDNPHLERLLQKFRTFTGNAVIEKREGYRPMLRTLKEGKGLAILMDQNVSTDERIFVKFFDKEASTTPAVGLLHIKTDAALIPAFALPLAGDRYRFIYGSPLEIPLTGNREEDVQNITQQCTEVIEKQIRKYPEYWLWMHRRWKTQPDINIRNSGTRNLEEVVKA